MLRSAWYYRKRTFYLHSIVQFVVTEIEEKQDKACNGRTRVTSEYSAREVGYFVCQEGCFIINVSLEIMFFANVHAYVHVHVHVSLHL